jgi:non-ribosomal peptide synthase protein (TIGR01720 family)
LGAKLYLIAHHLIFDQVSKIILLKDFVELYEQTMRNKPLKLIKSPSTYIAYNNKLKQLKDSLSIKNNIEYWKSQVNTNQKFPVDFEVNLPILEFDIETVLLSVDQNLTQNLQNIAKNKNNLIVDEILIASLTKTICEWSNQPEFIMVKENLGRQIDDDHLDFSETIGWLTSIFPIKVAYNESLNLKSFILDIKETVRTIPNKGLDYGILRYLVEDESIKKSLTHSAPVLFNHLGKMANSENIYNLEFRNKSSNSRSKLSERGYFFEINTYIENNELKINWSYSKKCHNSETMTNLLNSFNRNLEQIVEFCSNLGNDIYSASDFPDSDLDDDDLNELLSQL